MAKLKKYSNYQFQSKQMSKQGEFSSKQHIPRFTGNTINENL